MKERLLPREEVVFLWRTVRSKGSALLFFINSVIFPMFPSWLSWISAFLLFAEVAQSKPEGSVAEDLWYQGVVAYTRALAQSGKGEWLDALEHYQIAADRMAYVNGKYPGFQKEIVEFRLEALRNDAARTYNEICALDHDAADAYFGLLEQLAAGERQASLQDWEASVRTLLIVQRDLLGLRMGRPEFFPNTLRYQLRRCELQLQSSEGRLGATKEGQARLMALQKEIEDQDLMNPILPDRPEIAMSPALFP